MKNKILIILSLFILLIINSFTPVINIKASEISNSISTPITDDNTIIEESVKYYDEQTFDYLTLCNSNLDSANLFIETNKNNLNYHLENYRYGGLNSYFNFNESVEYDYLNNNSILFHLQKDNIVSLDHYDFNILKHNEEDGIYGLMLFERTINKNIYFDNDLKYISFYLNSFTSYNLLSHFNNMFEFTFEIPLLKIDGVEYLGIRFNGKDNGFQLFSKNCIFKIEKTKNNTGNDVFLYKLTIPRVDYFKKISQTYFIDYFLSMYESQNISDEQLLKNRMFFAFDNEMSNKFYDYAFDINTLNIKEKYFIVNQLSYSYLRLTDDSDLTELSSAKFKNISFEVVYTKNSNNLNYLESLLNEYKIDYSNYKCVIKNVKSDDGEFLYQLQIIGDYVVSINNNIGYVDGLIKYVYFEDFEIPFTFDNFSFNVKSLTFYPMITGVSDLSDYTFVQDYTKVNYQKYTVSYNRTARKMFFNAYAIENVSKDYNLPFYRTPNYEIGHKKTWKEKIEDISFDAMEWCSDVLGFETYWCSQSLYFDFYFDEEMINPVPNVHEISFKYQKGFKKANKSDDNGFYLDDKYNGTSKSIKYITLDVNPKFNDKTYGDGYYLYAWSEDIEIDNTLSLKVHRDNEENSAFKYKYKIENLYEVDSEKDKVKNFLNGFSPIEIHYHTDDYESIPLVANSLGLHIEYDENGKPYVFDGDGNYRPDYDIFTTDTGFHLVGLDSNNDGIISENETVNNDTGTWEKMPEELVFPEDKTLGSELDKLFNNIGDFFDNVFDSLGSGFETIGLIISIIIGFYLFKFIIKFVVFIKNLFSKKKKSK